MSPSKNSLAPAPCASAAEPKPRTAPVTATEIVSDFITGVPPKDAPAFSLCLLPIITRRDWDLKSPRRLHLERATRPPASDLVPRLPRTLPVPLASPTSSPRDHSH